MRQLEERMLLAIRATRMVTWEWFPSEGRVTTSDNYAHLYGLPTVSSAEDACALVLPQDKEAHLAKVLRIATEGGTYDSEFRIKRPVDGRIFWLEERAEAHLGWDGRVERVIGITLDITERKRHEAAVREGQERQSFLLKLSDALRPLEDPIAIQDMAARILGEHLGCAWTYYAEYDNPPTQITVRRCHARANVQNLAGVHPIGSFAFFAPLASGRSLAIPDIDSHPNVTDGTRALLGPLGMRSLAGAPIAKGGVLQALIVVADTVPRAWSEHDMLLLEEVAERTWSAVERANAEEALRESEAKYRSLFEIIEDGYAFGEVIRDDKRAVVDYRLIEANHAWARHTGISLNEAIDRPYTEWTRRIDAEAFARVASALETGVPTRYEVFNQGLERWLDLQIVPRGERFACLFADVTVRKRTELALRASEERHGFLLKLSDALRPLSEPREIQRVAAGVVGEYLQVDRALYAEFDADGREYTIVDNYLRAGVPKRVGRFPSHVFSGVIEWFSSGKAPAITDVRQTTALSDVEKEAATAAGILALAAVPLIKNGRLVAYLVVEQSSPREWTSDEITILRETAERTWAAVEQQRANEALRKSEERQAFLLKLSDALRPLVDPAAIQSEAARLVREHVDVGWCYYAEFDEGKTVNTIRRGALRDGLTSLVGVHDLSGVPKLTELLHSGGVFVTADITTSAFLNPSIVERYVAIDLRSVITVPLVRSGRLIAMFLIADTLVRAWDENVVALVRDVAERTWVAVERAHAEAALRASEARLQRADRAKDEFLATLGHELRTPLAAITLWAGALRSGNASVQESSRALDAIIESASAQSRLVDDLLDLTRLMTGKLLLRPVSVDIETIARAIVDGVRPMAEAKNLTLEVALAADLGCAVLDPARLKQVLWNLLSNAIKFTPKNGTVSLRIRKTDGFLEAVIADTGEGISTEFFPHLFERFRQADMRETRQHGGLGIGLALSRQLVELQGGTISARSDGRDLGATFEVRLPWIDGSAAGERVPPLLKKSASSDEMRRLDGVTILLVEDDSNTLAAMELMLRSEGASVLTARSGGAALDLFETADAPCKPVVLVSDLGLPGMSGYELVERIASLRRSRGLLPIPACAVSAHARDADRQRAINAGFDMHVPKPVAPERLIEAVADLVQMTDAIASDRPRS